MKENLVQFMYYNPFLGLFSGTTLKIMYPEPKFLGTRLIINQAQLVRNLRYCPDTHQYPRKLELTQTEVVADFVPAHSALKLEKKCNIKSAKTHFLLHQK